MGLEYLKARKNELNMTTEELSEKSGVPLGTLNKILAGQTMDPKFETLKAICKALEIRLSDLDEYESQNGYYLDPEAAEIAQEVQQRPELKILFDASRKVSADDLKFVVDMIDRMQGKKNDYIDDLDSRDLSCYDSDELVAELEARGYGADWDDF